MMFINRVGFLVGILYNSVFGSQDISHFPGLKPLLSDIVIIAVEILFPFGDELEVELLLLLGVGGGFPFTRHYIIGKVPVFAFLY